MKRIVGVLFWDKKVHLSWGEADSISTASFNLPADLRRDDILEQEFLLQGVFKAIREYLREKAGISEFGLAVCTPDNFGLEDSRRIINAGKECDIEIVKTVSETMAMSLAIYGEYDFDGRMLAAVTTDKRLSIAEYDFSDRGVEKKATYIAGPWNGTSIAKSSFVQSYSERSLENAPAGLIFVAGSMNACMSFEQSLKSFINNTGAFRGGDIQLKIVDSSYIVEGLGYLAGKLEGRDAFAGLGVLDSLSPYEIYISIDGDMFFMADADTPVPKDLGFELKKLPEGEQGNVIFRFFEKKGRRFEEIGGVSVPRDNLSDFYRKPVWIGMHIDSDKNMTLLVQIMENDKYIEFPVGTVADEKSAAASEVGVPEFIEKILPIIDNLEYASKFAQDESNPYTKGIIQTYENAINILAQNGITVISGEGEPFDFNLQNAVAHVADVDLPENTVKQVMQTGYMYNGKVIRTASVIVAN